VTRTADASQAEATSDGGLQPDNDDGCCCATLLRQQRAVNHTTAQPDGSISSCVQAKKNMAHISTPHLTQLQRVLGHLQHQLRLLLRCGKVDAALQHTAAMPVRGNLHAMLLRCIIHKLAVIRAQPLQAALDDMIAVEVLDQGQTTPAPGPEITSARCSRLVSVSISFCTARVPCVLQRHFHYLALLTARASSTSSRCSSLHSTAHCSRCWHTSSKQPECCHGIDGPT